MRSKRHIVVWLAALLLVAGSAMPAAAKKPDKPGGDPPAEVLACEDFVENGVIPLTGGGFTEFECNWTPVDPGDVGDWYGTIGISTSRELGSLVVFVRDSSPGDVCLLEQLSKPVGLSFEFEVPLVDGADEYWDGNQTNWCTRFDEFGGREDLNLEPLHLLVNFRSRPGTVVTLTLGVVDMAPGQ